MSYDILYAIIFWLLWALLAFVILRQFYGQKDILLANRLRLSLLLMQAVAVVLFFFPFTETVTGTMSGWHFIFQGKPAVTLYFIFLLFSFLLFFLRFFFILRVAIGIHFAANFLLFAAIITLLPETEQFLLFSPFLSVFVLILADVLCVLLLRQIDQLEREGFHL